MKHGNRLHPLMAILEAQVQALDEELTRADGHGDLARLTRKNAKVRTPPTTWTHTRREDVDACPGMTADREDGDAA